jgi:hypothetical protein
LFTYHLQEDSILLWKSIVANPLLKSTELILFLNKCDILRTKLLTLHFANWVISYGDRPNDFENVSNCKLASIVNFLQTYEKPCLRHEKEVWYDIVRLVFNSRD